MSVTLDIPFPPSVNGLFSGKERRYTADHYKTWKSKAVKCLTNAPMVVGPVNVTYTFTKPKNKDGSTNKTKRDLGNLEKAVSDILVKMSVIEDDSLIQRIILQWGETDKGCRVEIKRTQEAP